MDKDGVTQTCTIDESGSYTLKDVVYGPVRFSVLQRAKDQKTMSELRKEYKKKGEQLPPDIDLSGMHVRPPFSSKYMNPETSGLTTTVSQANTTFDIDLVDEAEAK